METIRLQLNDIKDTGSATVISNTVRAIEGVALVRVAQASNQVTVQFDPAKLAPEQLRSALAQAGFESRLMAPATAGGCCGACGG
jgi:copper chaperone CopZ